MDFTDLHELSSTSPPLLNYEFHELREFEMPLKSLLLIGDWKLVIGYWKLFFPGHPINHFQSA